MSMETIKISNSKIAIISDLHLGVHTNSSFWHTTAINWAKWLKDELKKQEITDIIFCGDWHHNRSEISVSTLQVSADILDILRDFNLIAIAGNHDMFFKTRTDVNSLSIFKNRKNITIIDTNVAVIHHGDKILSLCPWNTPIANIPESSAIFGHFEIETFSMNAYKMCSEGIKTKDLLAKSPLVFSGHFHIRQQKNYNQGTVIYVGNPFQMDFGDIDNDKGYYIFDINTSEYNFVKNNISPQYKKVPISKLTDTPTFNEDIKQAFYNNIVKLKIDKDIEQESIDLILQKLHALKPAELTIDYDINFNRLSVDVDEKQDLSGIDIEQAIHEFVNLLDIKNKESIISYTTELYRRCIS